MGIGTVIQGVGMAYSAYSAYAGAKASNAAMEYQAQIARNNASMDDWRAADAINRGQISEADQRMKTGQLKGRQRALMAARGIDLGEGSALDILTTTDLMGERDALTIRDNAVREAWGYTQQANNARGNADVYQYRADSNSPLTAAASTVLTSGGTVASSWYRWKDKAEGAKGHAQNLGYAPGAYPGE